MRFDGQAPTPGQLINGLQPGRFLKLGRVVGGGSLEARRLSSGIQLYWRYTMRGKTDRIAIGNYDPKAPPKSLTRRDNGGYSLLAAMLHAERLAAANKDAADAGGLRGVRAASATAKVAAEHQTLDKLLTDYCDHLEGLGRPSHREARSILEKHVRSAWPQLVKQPAVSITAEDITDMMRKVVDARKGRTANKLRSYLRSAYQTAKSAKTKASVPVSFKDFGISANPVADTQPDEAYNKADKHPLTRDELRAYWQIICKADGIRGAVLRLHLLTGGQRIEQFVKLKTTDVKDTTITLYDGKGRPGKPARPNTVPLTKRAGTALAACKPDGLFALSTSGGDTHIAATTLSAWAVEAARDTIPEFKAKRIRSGVETMLASLGVSQETRGRLQSHGVSGVQARHYDGHDYLREKQEALLLLEKELIRR